MKAALVGVALLVLSGIVLGPTSLLGGKALPVLLLLGGVLLVPLLWSQRSRLVLVLVLLPTLLQFQYAGGRLKGDGVMYYVFVRSIVKDHDLDLTNEYAHYDLLRRGDIEQPTVTGMRRSIFAIGPAVASLPFFLVGELYTRVQQVVGGDVDLSGYGAPHRNAVALGGLLYGFLGVWLVHDLLRRHFAPGIALGGSLLIWLATFHHWYMVQEPTMSHAFSMAASALVLWLWDRNRGTDSPGAFFLLGLALGLAACIRWQNGVLLVLPALDLVVLRRKAVLPLLTLGAGVLIGIFPQMYAWHVLFDEWILRAPPHGTDFLRLNHPYFWNTLFSSRHGLLSWTPVLWGGYLGFPLLLRREPRMALPLLVPLVLMTYVNVCSGDWWAGGSFSNRRFDSLLPILALGLAAFLSKGMDLCERHPEGILPVVCLPFVLANLLLVWQVQRGLVRRDDTVFFPALVGQGARLFSESFGSPNTWPASLIFAASEGRPPGQYDSLVGQYLFYRQNNLGGHIPLGSPGDEAFLGEGWGGRESTEGQGGRRLLGRGRVLLPLDESWPLDLRLRARGAASNVLVLVNGHEVGAFSAGAEWTDARFVTGAEVWRREINDLVLDAHGGEAWIGPLDLARRNP